MKIANFLPNFLKPRTTLSVQNLWFLDEVTWSSRSARLPSEVRVVLEAIRSNGFAVIKSAISPVLCDEIVRDFAHYVLKSEESLRYRDQFGHYDRLACFHLSSEPARQIAYHPAILGALDAAFAEPAVVVGSLYFDKGSQQSMHRDTPAFFTNPLNRYFGVWTALEDVVEGAGPLMYYPGSHTIVSDSELRADVSVNSKRYFEILVRECQRSGLEKVLYYPKKGDTLIWHPQLVHGGHEIINPRLSRSSIVFHYIAGSVPIYGADVFFDRTWQFSRRRNYQTLKWNGREMIDQGAPRFFENRYEGNFDEK